MGDDSPIFLNYQDPYERFRIGQGAGSWNADPAKRKPMPGTQFPVEAYDNYMKQSVPRWLSTDKAVVAAYRGAGRQGLPVRAAAATARAAISASWSAEQRPGQDQGDVAVESASAGDHRERAEAQRHPGADALRRLRRPASALGGLQEDRHRIRQRHQGRGRHVDLVNLPDIGIKGNSHMLMQDKNNAEIAEVIQKWLVAQRSRRLKSDLTQQ